MARYLTIPPEISPLNRATGTPYTGADGQPESFSLLRFLQLYVFDDQAMPQGRDTDKTIARVEAILEGAHPGDVLEIESADWAKIKEVIEHPKTPSRRNSVTVQLLSLQDAWCEAKEKDPRNGIKPTIAGDPVPIKEMVSR